MIPKVIHYCWFGKGEKSDLMQRCISSWEKHFPDYEIIEWNEANFDVTQNNYCKEAYENKKWAFVSDYARLSIIYEHGGIYLDTDVEVIKPFGTVIKDKGYLCFQNTSNDPMGKEINTGNGFAAEKGNSIIGAMMHDYDHLHFLVNNEYDLTPCTERNTQVLIKYGLVPNGKKQTIGNIVCYPIDWFCGNDMANSHPVITMNTYTIHHYVATWKEPSSLCVRIKYRIIIKTIQKLIGYSNYDKLKKFMKK